MTFAEFNRLDRRIDALMLAAAGEPFLTHTLRPLHTIYRRIGFIHHRYMPGQADLSGTIDRHLAILSAVANRHVDRAVAATDALIDFMDACSTEWNQASIRACSTAASSRCSASRIRITKTTGRNEYDDGSSPTTSGDG